MLWWISFASNLARRSRPCAQTFTRLLLTAPMAAPGWREQIGNIIAETERNLGGRPSRQQISRAAPVLPCTSYSVNNAPSSAPSSPPRKSRMGGRPSSRRLDADASPLSHFSSAARSIAPA